MTDVPMTDFEMIDHQDTLIAALCAQEYAEEQRSNCPDCEGAGEWAECGRCSDLFGAAIDLRIVALRRFRETASPLQQSRIRRQMDLARAAQLVGESFSRDRIGDK